MISDVIIKPLIKIPDERGCIFPMLRSDAVEFKGFGEVNFLQVYPGTIKGWYLNKKMILSMVVISGMIKLVLFDSRRDSKTLGEIQEIFMGDLKYIMVQIPNGVWYGLKGITIPSSIVANCSTTLFDTAEILFMDPSTTEIPYQWGVKHG